MPRYRATLAYDGTAYQGFQRQAGEVPTIQLAVEQAITAVTSLPVTIKGAGRTDSGVHATGQVIAFDVEWRHDDDALLRAINANLPGDIALQEIRQHDGFHPRFDALSRLYRYSVVQSAQRQPLLRHRAWQLRGPLDLEVMQQAAALLVGRHDFASFGPPPQGEGTVREVRASRWMRKEQPYGALFVYEVEANAFLQHMARRVVGLLVDVGRGKVTLAEFGRIFRSADLSQVKIIAPPQGLILEKVRYSDDD
jgi:tRNA pseudouridine38-40 synthase